MVNLNCHQMDDGGKGCEEDAGRAQGDVGGRGAGAAQAPARLWEKRVCGFGPRRAATGLGANSGAQTGGSGASGCAAARLCGRHSEKRGAAAAPRPAAGFARCVWPGFCAALREAEFGGRFCPPADGAARFVGPPRSFSGHERAEKAPARFLPHGLL